MRPLFHHKQRGYLGAPACVPLHAERHDVAVSSIERIMWSLSRQLTVLAETENDRSYLEKILKVFDAIYEGDESEYIKGIRSKVQVGLFGQTTK